MSSRMTRTTSKAREESKHETREALISAGLSVFAEEGLHEPSLDAICARAGYTRGAFYVHFRDREDFVAAVMERTMNWFMDAMMATDGAAASLESAIKRFACVVAHGAPGFLGPGAVKLYQLLDACTSAPVIRERFARVLHAAVDRIAGTLVQGQQQGQERSDVSARAVATLLLAAVIGVQAMVDMHFPLDTQGISNAVLGLLRAPQAAAVSPAPPERTMDATMLEGQAG